MWTNISERWRCKCSDACLLIAPITLSTHAEHVRAYCIIMLSYCLQYCWRWTGYSYSFDVLVSFNNRCAIYHTQIIVHQRTIYRLSSRPYSYMVYLRRYCCGVKIVKWDLKLRCWFGANKVSLLLWFTAVHSCHTKSFSHQSCLRYDIRLMLHSMLQV